MRKPKADGLQLSRARRLRREATPAENILWPRLRGRLFSGFKFRRQVPLGKFIADFYCHEAMLIVELDGQSHFGNDTRDGERQKWFEQKGFRLLRFWNSQIYEDCDTVMKMIWAECQAGVKQKARREQETK